MRRPRRPHVFLLAFVLIAAACGEISTPGEQLRILAQPLEPAFVNEPYVANVRPAGGLSPYRYILEAGRLPPGIELQGGSLRGTPTQTGRYSFTITVVDANLSRTFREFTLEVVEPPPAELRLNVPATEMRTTFRVQGRIDNARELQGFRSLVTWDAQAFRLVPGSVRPLQRGTAFFHGVAEGRLHVDLAVLGGTVDGSRAMFEFELEPLLAAAPSLAVRSELVARDGRHVFDARDEGAPPPRTRAQPADPAAGGEPADEPTGDAIGDAENPVADPLPDDPDDALDDEFETTPDDEAGS